MFGGSTVYGIGPPDSATIPSYLSRELNVDPSTCLDVTNLGAEGYVTNQEPILLIQQLKAGRRPDIAVFYDGINDSLVGGFALGFRLHIGTSSRRGVDDRGTRRKPNLRAGLFLVFK